MEDETQSDQLNEIVDNLLGCNPGRRRRTLSGHTIPPFDITRPNIHDSKREFLKELETVEYVVQSLRGLLIRLIASSNEEADIEHNQMIERLSSAIEVAAHRNRSERTVTSAGDLALQNLGETGFFRNSRTTLIHMLFAYNQRLNELRDQERQFWNVPHRAPNYYARTIALRLARVYAKEKRQRPTFGIAREGNHPSTAFGRALEEVFSVLKVDGSVRGAAEWAINELTEEDLMPKVPIERGIMEYLNRTDQI